MNHIKNWLTTREHHRDRILDMVEWTIDDDGFVLLPHCASQQFEYALAVVLESGDDAKVCKNLLGTYDHMQSPGTITLYRDKIGACFWGVIYRLDKAALRFTSGQLSRLASVALEITYTHEQFHHYCDVMRKISNSPYDSLMEEALAVAWSWHQLNANSLLWPEMPQTLLSAFITERFQYAGLGYRDWINFKHQHVFDRQVAVHVIGMATCLFLEQSGVGTGELITQLMRQADWTAYSVILLVLPADEGIFTDLIGIGQPGSLTSNQLNVPLDVDCWLRNMGISNYTLNTNGNVTVHGDVNLSRREINGSLPVQFDIVKGHFNCSNNALNSLKGFPTEVWGDLCCHGNNLQSMKGIGYLAGSDLPLSIKRIDGIFCLRGNPIFEGGIGAISIKNLKGIEADQLSFSIINRYLQRSEDVFECQAELINAGHEAYAEL